MLNKDIFRQVELKYENLPIKSIDPIHLSIYLSVFLIVHINIYIYGVEEKLGIFLYTNKRLDYKKKKINFNKTVN